MRGRRFGILVVAALLLLAGLAGRSFLDRDEAPDMAAVVELVRKPMVSAPSYALAQTVDGVGFPDWSRWGWTARGGRTDTFPERRSAAVMYERGGQRIAVVIVSGTRDVNSLQPTREVQRDTPSGKVAVTLGGTVSMAEGAPIPEPADVPVYLCGNPDACELSAAHMSAQRKVDGRTVVLVGWPVSASMRRELEDLSVRDIG